MFRLSTSHWHVLRINFLMAGTFALLSALLSLFVHPLWIGLAAFVGVMQIVFALTGFCPSAILLARLGVPRS